MLDELKIHWQGKASSTQAAYNFDGSSVKNILEKRINSFSQYEWGRIPSLVMSLIALAMTMYALLKGLEQVRWQPFAFAMVSTAWTLAFAYRFYILHRYRDYPEQNLLDFLEGAILRLTVMHRTQRFYAYTAAILLGGWFLQDFQIGEWNMASLIGVAAFALLSFGLMAIIFWYQRSQHTGSKRDMIQELNVMRRELLEGE